MYTHTPLPRMLFKIKKAYEYPSGSSERISNGLMEWCNDEPVHVPNWSVPVPGPINTATDRYIVTYISQPLSIIQICYHPFFFFLLPQWPKAAAFNLVPMDRHFKTAIQLQLMAAAPLGWLFLWIHSAILAVVMVMMSAINNAVKAKSNATVSLWAVWWASAKAISCVLEVRMPCLMQLLLLDVPHTLPLSRVFALASKYKYLIFFKKIISSKTQGSPRCLCL